MLNKIKQKLTEIQKKREDKKRLLKLQNYYKEIQRGSYFLKYIYEDLQKQSNGLNRHQRRRFEKDLKQKGKFSEEIVKHYSDRVDMILTEIDQRLNPVKIINKNKVYENGASCECTTNPGQSNPFVKDK